MFVFKLEMIFLIFIGVIGVIKKLLYCEVVKNFIKDLFIGCIVLVSVGLIEEKYLLKVFVIFLVLVKMLFLIINLFGDDSLLFLKLINCLIFFYVVFILLIWYEKYLL